MAQPQIYLLPEKYYHIYNKGNYGEKLFYSSENFDYFLKKYYDYIQPVDDTLSYCLMLNHFHLLVHIKKEKDLLEFLNEKKINYSKQANLFTDEMSLIISKQFSNLFNGYAQAVNKQRSRTGSLFSRAFKRKEIDSIEYLRNLIIYIHTNPVNHGFVPNLKDWKYSSYPAIISGYSNEIKINEVVDMFGDIDNFEKVCNLKAIKGQMKKEMD
jgi:putative transposase